ncbi:hypothetical protein TCDM_06452 [Trypanosoma cruzi Dm28c]|uniref:Uncharacterized protein n=1 Tax=Trypanosoma cruzi Dm28c TaxID=1416333 RepID=V5DCR1_TRYCR|nr:hypothetical protein TCDM_06452 [Trypanosoma cruzi Dm28c]PBJ68328.1 hypothetical protein BCY84_21739 [Trypanosoma cruzi cruzi]
MVLEKGVPFKITLHPSVFEQKSVLGIPLSFTATVVDKELQHRLEFCVPSGPGVSALEITNVEFLFETKKLKGGARKSSRSSSLNGGSQSYLFMQMLDSQGRSSSHPLAVVCCDAAMGRGILSRVKLPLQTNQRVRFYLVERKNQEDEKMDIKERVVGVRFTGILQLLSGGVHVRSAKTRKQIQALMEGSLNFEADSCDEKVSTLKRDRDSFYHHRDDEEFAKGGLRSDKARSIPTESIRNDLDEEPPNLIYAFVSGGDDES